uniref:Uncharacterized protein n=1 Tax=Strongyloides stercoralis TaxID=6248 RepID=A0A0K0E3S5_STRER
MKLVLLITICLLNLYVIFFNVIYICTFFYSRFKNENIFFKILQIIN